MRLFEAAHCEPRVDDAEPAAQRVVGIRIAEIEKIDDARHRLGVAVGYRIVAALVDGSPAERETRVGIGHGLLEEGQGPRADEIGLWAAPTLEAIALRAEPPADRPARLMLIGAELQDPGDEARVILRRVAERRDCDGAVLFSGGPFCPRP